jgi:hypothetical protein
MKSSYKLALLAALGLASVTAAQAQYSGDLLVGIYDPALANTYVYDLGTVSPTDGQTWDLSSLTPTIGSAGFGSTLSLADQWGVVGYLTGASDTLYASGAVGGAMPPTIKNNNHFNASGTVINTIGGSPGSQPVNSYSGTGPDWYSQTLNGGLLASLGYNINVPTDNTALLWQVVADNSAPSAAGAFSLNYQTEVLTYSVPEPTSMALFGGAGLLMLAFRNKFSRK